MKMAKVHRSLLTLAALTFLVLISSASLWAQNDDKVPYRLYRGIRPMGMGGAFEAVADDINAFHYNPAGLVNNRHRFQLLIVRPQATENAFSEIKEVRGWLDDVKPISQSRDPLGDPKLAETRKSLLNRFEGLIGKNLGVDADFPAISIIAPFSKGKSRLAVGGSVYTQTRTLLKIERRGLKWQDPIVDMLDNAIFYDTTITLNLAGGAAIQLPIEVPRLASSKVSIGVAFRKSLLGWSLSNPDQPLTVADVVNPDGLDGVVGTDDDFKERFFDPDKRLDNFDSISTFGIDFGTVITPIDGLNGALVLRNAASSFSKEGEAKSHPSNLILSVSASPFKLIKFDNSKLDLLVAASVEDLSGSVSDLREKAKSTDKVHLGLEALLTPFSGLSLSGRLGNNQGFPTVGVSAKIGMIYFDIARFGDVEDDWYALSVRFAF